MGAERQPGQERSTLSTRAEEALKALVAKVTRREHVRNRALREVGGEEGVIWPSRRYEVSEIVNEATAEAAERLKSA